MSSASENLPHTPPDEVVSREDFELLRSFLRVARLLQAQPINLDPALTQHTRHYGTSRGNSGPNHLTNTPSSIGQAAGLDNDYDDDNDDDDDEDDDDDDDEYEEEVARPKRNDAQSSQHEQHISQQKNTRASTQRRRQQQQAQQQQQEQRQLRQQPQPQPQQQPQQQNPQQQPQPRRQRPHAAVEKRYRSVLNSKIQQLSASIPTSNTFSLTDPTKVPPSNPAAGEAAKVPTKSVVLDRAIQYINHLVSTYEQFEAEQNNLRGKLQLWLDDSASSTMANSVKL